MKSTYYILLAVVTSLLSCGGISLDSTVTGQTDPTIAPDTTYTYIALGDSYTIGESVLPSSRFPNQLTTLLAADSTTFDATNILATTGWTTAELLAAMDDKTFEETPADIVTLLIGVNNQYRGQDIALFQTEFAELLDRAIALAGGEADHVIVVSIPDYGYTPFGESNKEKISAELDQYNSLKEEMTIAKNARYVNITDISRRGLEDPSLVASDKLHPSGEQYRLWAERIAVVVKEVLE